jgi:predicted RNA polymerase sigma factor
MKDVPKAIEAVWKIESTRLIAAIARVTHDIGTAEELARDALVTALELWPVEGITRKPRRVADDSGQTARHRFVGLWSHARTKARRNGPRT